MDRTLKFYYNPSLLKKDVNLVFTFQPPTQEPLTDDQNCAAWKIAQLTKNPGTTASFDVHYSGRLGFSVAEIEIGNIIQPEIPVEVKAGQITTFTDNPRGWSSPTERGGPLLRATNNTDMYQDIAVGTVTEDKHGFIDLIPTFLFKAGAGRTVEADFRPKLMMYVNHGYRENALLRAEDAAPPIWDANLAELGKHSTWVFAEDDQGGYKVTPR
ncbi:hypothetical protein L218DRAFT_1006666 [Marasmius fiardii PR-910]|nr:hypothetical protein L218DRAFT_1006666 [Marasmius fiardii PR-910]